MRLKVDIDCGATGGRGGTSNPRFAGKSNISATLTGGLAVPNAPYDSYDARPGRSTEAGAADRLQLGLGARTFRIADR
jgi:hypothetical protein